MGDFERYGCGLLLIIGAFAIGFGVVLGIVLDQVTP